ncbi:LexA family transcriptional regulator [Porphyromonadaceae bacterium W3.11]|nr:LexA family transcriptional regulator [Porphyromonadaceae bacterium W3.11]
MCIGIEKRIERLVDNFTEGNKSAFGLKVGLSEARVRSYINGTQPSADALAKIVKSFDISADWLLTGQGEMLRKVPSVASFDHSIQRNQPEVKTIGDFKVEEKQIQQQKVPLYELEATAGLFAQGDISQHIIDYISIPNAPRCDGAIVARGDSMAPTVKSGDILLYKEHDINNIMYGHMYIVDFDMDGDSMIVVKYVQRVDGEEDRILLTSENERYQPMYISLEQVRHIALVKVSVSFHTIA